MIERVKKTLGERVEDVRTTHRLTDSPACLALAEPDAGPDPAAMATAPIPK